MTPQISYSWLTIYVSNGILMINADDSREYNSIKDLQEEMPRK